MSRILFIDDTIFFAKACSDNDRVIEIIVDSYELLRPKK